MDVIGCSCEVDVVGEVTRRCGGHGFVRKRDYEWRGQRHHCGVVGTRSGAPSGWEWTRVVELEEGEEEERNIVRVECTLSRGR